VSISHDRETSASAPTEPSSSSSAPTGPLDAYHRELDYLCRSLERLGVRYPDVEDLAHEVFLVLSRKWQDFDQNRPLRPYLFGIAFRIAAQHRRRQLREVPSELPEIADTDAQPDGALSAAETRSLVLEALERVPLPRRAVLVMHDLDETPMRLVAKSLRIPLFTAYSRLRKARHEFERAINVLQRGWR